MNVVLSRFLRSPLGVGLWLSCAFSAAALSLGGIVPFYVSFPTAAAVGAAITLVLLLTPVGARSVVAEADRDRSERDARVLGSVAAARKRLSLLRIGDEPVAAELNRLVFAAGLYLERAVKTDSRDPEIEAAVLGAVEVVNDFLLLSDEAASARGHGADLSGAADISGRTIRALAASSDVIEMRLRSDVRASDRVAAREELR